MRGEQPQRLAARPMLEALEPRVLLDGASPDQALQLFSVSPALFVENQGQWADPAVRFVHNGDGANVAMTDSGPVFQVFRQVPREEADGGADNDLAGPPGDPFGPDLSQTHMLQFSATFAGANAATPIGMDPSGARFNYFVGDQANWRSDVPAYEQVAYLGLYDGIDLVTWGQRDSLKYEFHVAPGADWRQVQVRYEGIQGLSLAADGSLIVALGEDWGEVTDDAPAIYQTIGGERFDVAGRFVLLDERTYSFEVTGPYDPAQELVLDPDLAWLTYLGEDCSEGAMLGQSIAVDSDGNTYITGYTAAEGLATAGAYDTTMSGELESWYDIFVAKFNPTASTLVYFTYLGGSMNEDAYSIAVDSGGNAYVTGETSSSGLATAGAYDTTFGGPPDAFVAKFDATGSTLVYFTYLGGNLNSGNRGYGIAVDSGGNAYVTGATWCAGLATAGAFDTTYNGPLGYSDAFVAKFNPTGSTLVYFTYLGGSADDYGYGIAVDSGGNAYVTGETSSSDLATAGAYDTLLNTGPDAFVAKFNPTGSTLICFTYLGGTGSDYGRAIAVDSGGSPYVAGDTSSSGLATAGAHDTTYGGHSDAFVAKFDATASALVYFTYLGGSGGDYGYGIAVDSAGNAYVTGYTYSSGLATPGAYDTTYRGGGADAFVAKFNPTGSTLVYSTYLGGSADDYGYGIAVDSAGNAYVTGLAGSPGLATAGAYDTLRNASGAAFVAKFNATANTLIYFTYLGGSGDDYGSGIAMDSGGNAYVTGTTSSSGLATAGAHDTTFGDGSCDAFVAKFNATDSALVYFTYLGGSKSEYAFGIAVDSGGNAYVTGYTYSSGLATAGAYDTTLGGSTDAFVAKFNPTGSALVYFTYLGGTMDDFGYAIAVDSLGNAYVSGYTSSSGVATAGAYDTTFGGGLYDAFQAKFNPTGSALVYFTYLGGSGYDYGYGVAVDSGGNAYVTGCTYSAGLATAGAYDTAYDASADAFVAKFNPAGSTLVYLTYLGGSGGDYGRGIAVDSGGNAYVTGETSSSGLATAGAYDTVRSGTDAFVAKFDPTASTIVYFTYLGGTGTDRGRGIAVDSDGNAYVTGETSSSGLATAGAYDTTFGDGSYDAFVAKFNATGSALLYFTYLGGSDKDYGCGIAVNSVGNAYVTGYTYSAGLATAGAYDTVLTSGFDAFVAKFILPDLAGTRVQCVGLNARTGRTASSIEPSGIGIRTIEIAFNEIVNFMDSCVQVNIVTFPGGVELLGPALLPLSVDGSGTSAMTITFASGAVVDTWVKVRLIAAAITDGAGNALDGEAAAGGSGCGYIYSAALDLPTGDGTPGGDAVFYVGSLRGDFSGDLAITAADKEGFAAAWRAGSLDADFRGVGFGPRPPDGGVTVADINGFTSAYQRGIAEGIHLDPLPLGGESLAAGVPEPLPMMAQAAAGSESAGADVPGMTEAAAVGPVPADAPVANGRTLTPNLSAALLREGGVTSPDTTWAVGVSGVPATPAEAASALDLRQPQDAETVFKKLWNRSPRLPAAGIAVRIP
ncbi:MAG: SBBP repeat-containing protein [Planctomycetes bacterium]|nr:SBBP repeat-containing protein [Planctomycetota bacterium]